MDIHYSSAVWHRMLHQAVSVRRLQLKQGGASLTSLPRSPTKGGSSAWLASDDVQRAVLRTLPVLQAEAAAPLGRKRSRSGTKRPPKLKPSDAPPEHPAPNATGDMGCGDGRAGDAGAGSGPGFGAEPRQPLEWVAAGCGRVRIAEAGAMRAVLEAAPDAAAAADLGGSRAGTLSGSGVVANGAAGAPGPADPAGLPALRVTVEWASEGGDQGRAGPGGGAAADAGRARCRMRAQTPVPPAALRHWEELAGGRPRPCTLDPSACPKGLGWHSSPPVLSHPLQRHEEPAAARALALGCAGLLTALWAPLNFADALLAVLAEAGAEGLLLDALALTGPALAVLARALAPRALAAAGLRAHPPPLAVAEAPYRLRLVLRPVRAALHSMSKVRLQGNEWPLTTSYETAAAPKCILIAHSFYALHSLQACSLEGAV